MKSVKNGLSRPTKTWQNIKQNICMYMSLLNCLGCVCGFVSYYEHGYCDCLSAWMM